MPTKKKAKKKVKKQPSVRALKKQIVEMEKRIEEWREKCHALEVLGHDAQAKINYVDSKCRNAGSRLSDSKALLNTYRDRVVRITDAIRTAIEVASKTLPKKVFDKKTDAPACVPEYHQARPDTALAALLVINDVMMENENAILGVDTYGVPAGSTLGDVARKINSGPSWTCEFTP